jgi:F-type H+-transporting ATPase subunit delta
LSQKLTSVVGGPVEIRNVVDPDIVGGVVTTIGDRVIDGSIRAKLDQMKEAL